MRSLMYWKLTILLMLIVSLTGCLFHPVNNTQPTTYLLSATQLPQITASPSQLTLLVDTPTANQAYNTRQMAYIAKPYQIAYFSENSWADTPAQMLMPLIVQSLQNTGHFHAVVSAPFVGHYDLALTSQIIKLQQDFLQNPSQLRLVLRAQLIENTNRRVIASKQFTITNPASSNDPYGGVIAANQATSKLLQQLTEFCLQATNIKL